MGPSGPFKYLKKKKKLTDRKKINNKKKKNYKQKTESTTTFKKSTLMGPKGPFKVAGGQ